MMSSSPEAPLAQAIDKLRSDLVLSYSELNGPQCDVTPASVELAKPTASFESPQATAEVHLEKLAHQASGPASPPPEPAPQGQVPVSARGRPKRKLAHAW